MNFSDDDTLRQLELGEDSNWLFEWVEFAGDRPSSATRHELEDEIAAFANGRRGVLLCGLADGGDLLHNSRDQLVALDSFLARTSSNLIAPALRNLTSHRDLPDGRRFVAVDRSDHGGSPRASTHIAFVLLGHSLCVLIRLRFPAEVPGA